MGKRDVEKENVHPRDVEKENVHPISNYNRCLIRNALQSLLLNHHQP
jgi:hypothetical protein